MAEIKSLYEHIMNILRAISKKLSVWLFFKFGVMIRDMGNRFEYTLFEDAMWPINKKVIYTFCMRKAV